ncbi:hypothetical protein B0H11DRAFT_1298795 [Mycena galericulata]|nr:hypothetical protein B0H11DRAFT_1298795 [Mycena galericulata]
MVRDFVRMPRSAPTSSHGLHKCQVLCICQPIAGVGAKWCTIRMKVPAEFRSGLMPELVANHNDRDSLVLVSLVEGSSVNCQICDALQKRRREIHIIMPLVGNGRIGVGGRFPSRGPARRPPKVAAQQSQNSVDVCLEPSTSDEATRWSPCQQDLRGCVAPSCVRRGRAFSSGGFPQPHARHALVGKLEKASRPDHPQHGLNLREKPEFLKMEAQVCMRLVGSTWARK